MKHFTIHNNPIFDQKIEKDLIFIRDNIVKEFSKEIIALILVGGFGRGEGGIVFKDNNFQIVNDFDFHMVTKKIVSTEKINNFSNYLANSIGVKAVDIFVQPVFLPFLVRNSQYAFDLHNGGYLLYGNSDIFSKIPDPKRIALKEIEKLLFVRSWCFLGPIKKTFFVQNDLTADERFFLFQQLSKAILALEDAWLIFHNEYSSSYLTKLKNIQKYCNNTKLLNYFKWATNFKLNPSFSEKINPIKTYFEIKDYFFDKMLLLINAIYGKNFQFWNDYVNWYLTRIDVWINSMVSILFNKTLLYRKKSKKYLAKILLSVAFSKTKIDLTLTSEAYKLLFNKKIIISQNNVAGVWWNLYNVALKND